MTPAELARMEALCFPNSSTTWSERDFDTHLKNPSGITISDKTGFVIGRLAANEAEILTLCVLPEFRRNGHGAELLKSFEEQAKEEKASEIFLEVAIDNEAALALYASRGFTRVGRRRKYYANDQGIAVDANILKKEI